MSPEEYRGLQLAVACAQPVAGASLGLLSFDPEGRILLGSSNDPGRVPVAAPEEWSRMLLGYSRAGGTFRVRGPEVHVYWRKYRGWVVPRRLILR